MKKRWGRKFVQALAVQVALSGALAACLIAPALRDYIPHVLAALVAVNVGYGAANVWQKRGETRLPPEM